MVQISDLHIALLLVLVRAYQSANSVFSHNKSAPIEFISPETNQRAIDLIVIGDSVIL